MPASDMRIVDHRVSLKCRMLYELSLSVAG